MEQENKPIENKEIKNEISSVDLIEKANLAAQRLEVANKKQEELIARQEELSARELLSGRTFSKQEQPREETASEYKDRILRGKI